MTLSNVFRFRVGMSQIRLINNWELAGFKKMMDFGTPRWRINETSPMRQKEAIAQIERHKSCGLDQTSSPLSKYSHYYYRISLETIQRTSTNSMLQLWTYVVVVLWWWCLVIDMGFLDMKMYIMNYEM